MHWCWSGKWGICICQSIDLINQLSTIRANANSAPPAPGGSTNHKKQRKFRGDRSKSHQGDTPSHRVDVPTDVTPSDYIKNVNAVTLEEGEQLPASMMSKWKETNDRANFSKRLSRGELWTIEH